MVDDDHRPAKRREPVRRIGRRIQALALICLLVIGFTMALTTLRSPSSLRPFKPDPDLYAEVRWRAAKAINYTVSHYLFGYSVLNTASGVLRWRLFHDGGSEVWVGSNDWLYSTTHLKSVPDADVIMTARANLIAKIAAKLKAQNVDLVVAIVPEKFRIEAENLASTVLPQVEGRHAAWMALMAKRDVNMVDLTAVFAAQPNRAAFWWRTDTHWTQVGAALAARVIAARITTKIDRSHRFKTTADAEETIAGGNLLRLMGLENVPDGLAIKLRPPAEYEHVENTVEVNAEDNRGDPLGDGPKIEVALVGTSFSLTSNFFGYLEEALHARVFNAAADGGGFDISPRRYFRGKTFEESKPAVVIWEIPEQSTTQELGEDYESLVAWAQQ